MKRYAPYLCALPLALSASTLAGWLFSIDFLKRPLGQIVAMNPTTAMCLLLASIALLIYSLFDMKTNLFAFAKLLTALFSITGLAKLLALIGIDLHVDTWLFRDGVIAETLQGHINRMAPNTAFNLLLLGAIMLLLNSKNEKLKSLANYLALVVMVVGMFSFIGFIYRVKEYYGILNYLPMALQTAICFIALALGVLFKNNDHAFMQVISSAYSGGKIARTILPIAIVAPILLGFIRLYVSWEYPVAVELGVAMLVTSIIIIFLIAVWWVSRSLNISDAAHQQLKDLYHKMVQEVQDYAIISMDTEGNILNWNLGAEKIKGYQAGEIIGKNFRTFYPSEALEKKEPEKLLTQALIAGRATAEGWRVKKDGSAFWASVVITALHDENNNIIGLSKVTRDLTQRKKNETELQRQAELFNILPDGVIYGKADLTIASINKAAESLFEVNAAHALGLKISDIVQNDMTDQARDQARQHLWNGQGVWKGEATFTTRSGKKTAVLITLKSVTDSFNSGNAWVGIYTDVTTLKHTQNRLESALEAMVAGLWDWNIIDDTRWWSPRYFELLGYQNNEIQPSTETLGQLIHPDDASAVFESIKNNLVKPERFELEARFKLKAGNYRWFKITGSARFDRLGRPLNMTGAIIDIHDKKVAEELILEQSMLIQMAPDGIVYGTADNKIISLNESAEKLLETTGAEAIGKMIDDFLQVKIIGITREEVRKDLFEKGYSRHESELINRNNKKFTVLTSVKTVNNIPGHGPGWIAIYNDISPLRLNDELKAANNYLEQLAFISAHDIKSPIHTLNGLSELLLRSKTLDEKDRGLINMQQNVIHQMQRTNKALNDILKLRQGLIAKGSVQIETQHLGGIINNVVTGLSTDLENTGTTLNVDFKSVYEDQFPLLYMQSIFHNLLTNAIKFRDPKRPLVVNLLGKKLDDNTFSFVISDNGLGFDSERVKGKLFGIFKRFHAQIDGTGVGLHITKSIVDAYGGNIEVKSEPGKGATFKITLKNPILA